MSAPYRIGHFKADGQNSLGYFVCSSSQGVLAVQLVPTPKSLLVRRDITSHIEALHCVVRLGMWLVLM